MKAIKN